MCAGCKCAMFVGRFVTCDRQAVGKLRRNRPRATIQTKVLNQRDIATCKTIIWTSACPNDTQVQTPFVCTHLAAALRVKSRLFLPKPHATATRRNNPLLCKALQLHCVWARLLLQGLAPCTSLNKTVSLPKAFRAHSQCTWLLSCSSGLFKRGASLAAKVDPAATSSP